MANIRVNLDYTIYDGAQVSFKSPADCSLVTGLIIYYPDANKNEQSKEFKFADANAKDISDLNNVFGKNAIVKVILDVSSSKAFIQNANTNAYLEGELSKRFNSVASYYGQQAVNADDLLDPVALIPISDTKNKELRDILNCNFAFVQLLHIQNNCSQPLRMAL